MGAYFQKSNGYTYSHLGRLCGRRIGLGLVHVEAARQDGRWEAAYAGSAQMMIPDDFLAALRQNFVALTFYEMRNRANLYAIYHRLQTAKRVDTRQKRMDQILAQLASGKAFHGATFR